MSRLRIPRCGRAAAVATLAAFALPAAAAAASAPGAPGARTTWTSADKDGFGTAVGRRSKVWFTLSGGRLTEASGPTTRSCWTRSRSSTACWA